MINFVNDFFTLWSQDWGAIPTNSQTVDVDIIGYNSITIINLSTIQTIIFFPSGYNLPTNAKFEINGRELENCMGKLTIQFINTPINLPPLFFPYGRLLFIRKKYLI